MKNFWLITVAMLELDIGYPNYIYDKIFNEEKSYIAYVASLLNDEGFESRIVGYIMLELNKEESYTLIQGLFVEEDYRKRGIAKRLINEAEEYSKSIACQCMKAEARDYLLKFYRNLGFGINGMKNSSTYYISKNLERDKQIEEDDELEL